LCIDNEQVPFLYDENGNDLQSLRIKACPDQIIEAVEPTGRSNISILFKSKRNDSEEYIRAMLERILANAEETLVQLKKCNETNV
jgi:hypothetical protein